ncbi:expressed unknown protein [Ectocarpus siliculosus]|uniref:Uncharacterized protein n=1 Tax=Ectocarpus siliculosus TaxID=2880 RepID=D7FM84_ECTSI|nr:expressed unknown protein [Ectocarpus siliculosus]|eukprot:CBJ29907.1 expressed unknown protein [Ectocarpus siliculosus]
MPAAACESSEPLASADLEGAIKVVFLIVGKMAEDRGLSKYQSNQTCYQTGLSSGAPVMGGDGSIDGGQYHFQHPAMAAAGNNPFAHQHQQQPQWGGSGGRQGLNRGVGDVGGAAPGFGGGGPLLSPQQKRGGGSPGQQAAQSAAMGVRVPDSGLGGPMVAGEARVRMVLECWRIVGR